MTHNQHYQVTIFLSSSFKGIQKVYNSFFEQGPNQIYLSQNDFSEYDNLMKILNEKIRYLMKTRFVNEVDRNEEGLHNNLNWDLVDNPLTVREIINSLYELHEKILCSNYPEINIQKNYPYRTKNEQPTDYRSTFQLIRKKLNHLTREIKKIPMPDEMKSL